MTNKEAISVLNTIYGMMSPEVQKAIDAANKALIKDDYYHLDKMPDPECTVKFKYEDLHINSCGKCRHLIFKDYKHNEGFCDLTRLQRCFSDTCVYEEVKHE